MTQRGYVFKFNDFEKEKFCNNITTTAFNIAMSKAVIEVGEFRQNQILSNLMVLLSPLLV